MKKNTQKFTKSFWRSSFLAIAYLFSLGINAQDLMLQGIIDFDVPSAGSDGKAIHVLVINDIENLSLYGIGVANNGNGTDNQEYTFPAVSVLAGDNILVARSPESMASFLGATEANLMLANDDISQNGDDAIELFYNGEVIETFGDIDVDGTGEVWEYTDSWAYKVNGDWTYGGVACTLESETSATSECPYPYTGIYTVGEQFGDTFDVTFSVNTANIDVEETGIFLGGGVLGGSDEYAMADDDGDGTWTVTISLLEGTQGNYTFFNGPTASDDWSSGENLTGQECADPDNYYDRILQPITADTTLLHCFNSCETDGTCPSEFYNVTFSVNTANIEVGENGMYAGGGVLGDAQAYAMADDNMDGIWEVTVSLLQGTTGSYIFLNSPTSGGDWDAKENLAGQECADEDNFNDRTLAPVTEDTTLLHCFGSCGTDGTCPTEYYNITFNVNTANIEVGENGMFVGGGFVADILGGGANALPMTDEDGDGIWTASMEVISGTVGNYTYVNSTSNYDGKEDISGQDCADSDNWNDRVLDAPITEDTTLNHCYGSCETDGSCPAPATPTAVTFNVDMNDYGSEFTTVHVNGEFTNWCGSCGNVMTDEDGDGVYSLTMDINPGTYFWKFSVDGWDDQESFSEVIEGCTAENNNFFDRQIVIGDEALTASWVWNTCNALSISEATLLDMRIYPNPSNGDFVTIQTPVNGVKYVEVFDITGKRLINTSLSTDTLDISSMSSGLYLVKVTIEGQSKTSKLFIR
jgi:hypothetical protein